MVFNYIKYILLLTLVVCGPSQIHGQYIRISCDRPTLIYNNHVGNDWVHAFELSGNYYSLVEVMVVSVTEVDKLKLVISETKEKYPDSSSTRLGIVPDKLEWEKWYSKTVELVVKESNGRYAGNTAKWQVTFRYQKIHGRT